MGSVDFMGKTTENEVGVRFFFFLSLNYLYIYASGLEVITVII